MPPRCPLAGVQRYAARAPSQTSRSHNLRLNDTRDRHHRSPVHVRCSRYSISSRELEDTLGGFCVSRAENCTPKAPLPEGLARLAGSALAERVQSSGQLGAKVVRGGQQGGVTPHLGLALVLLGVRLRCVVEPLDPLLITARKEFPARSRVEAALRCLLLPEGVR